MIKWLWEQTPVEYRWIKLVANIGLFGVILILASGGENMVLIGLGVLSMFLALLIGIVSFVGYYYDS